MNTYLRDYRWRILALLFFATTINYIDRNVLSFTMIDEAFRKSMLELPEDAVLTEVDINHFKKMMGYVDMAFKAAYALGFIFVGWFIDKIGTKKGFTWAIIVWSLAGISTAFVGSFRGLISARFLLGIGESGNFPSAIKSVAEWFPRKERAFATGLFNAGANIGIITTAIAVPFITLNYGWRWSFVVTGLLGIILVFFWLWIYKKPEESTRISQAELDHIRSDKDEENRGNVKVSWAKLLTYKQTWALAIGKFTGDPIWWFYLTWLPDFFNSSKTLSEKLDLKTVGIPFIVIYLVSDFGSIFFGWLSSKFIQIGWSVGKARKVTMLICALCVVPIIFASITTHLWVAIALISLATAAHQGWSANVYTIASDLFPKNVVASVVGIGGMFGAIGGVLLAPLAGFIIVNFGYFPLFIIAGISYLVGITTIHFLLPNWERANIK